VKAIICKIADEYDRLAARATQQSQEEREAKRRQEQIAEMRLGTVGGVFALRANIYVVAEEGTPGRVVVGHESVPSLLLSAV
jgi:hypothetical protein